MSRFAHWLRLGHGRAAVKLQQGRGSRGEILAACLRDDVRDRQIEDHRGPYLWQLIQLCGDYAFFRPAIIDALHHGEPSEELFHLAQHMGSDACLQAMREAFARRGITRCGVNAALRLMEVDGLSGLLLALDSLPAEPDEDWRMAEARLLLRAWKPGRPSHPLLAEWARGYRRTGRQSAASPPRPGLPSRPSPPRTNYWSKRAQPQTGVKSARRYSPSLNAQIRAFVPWASTCSRNQRISTTTYRSICSSAKVTAAVTGN